MIITNEPFPSGVHLNDVSLISPVFADGELLGYVANLAHHVDVGGGAPASIGAFREVFQEGVIIPPVKVVEAGRIVDDVFDADPGADPLQARDGRRLPRADRRERDRAPAGSRRSSPGTGAATIVAAMARAARLHRAAHPGRARGAAARRLRGRGLGRHRRLHRRAGAAPRAGRDHADRRLVRPRRQRPAAPGAGQLDLRPDLLRLRVRAQVPDRPRPARSTTASTGSSRSTRRAGSVDELHLALARRRRLGDADPARRRDLPRPAARAPDGAARGDEGDDVPRRLRRRRPASRTSTSASSRRSAAATAAGTRATGRTRCRRTARTPRTRPSRRPSSTTRCASTGSRSSRTRRGRVASAAGSGCARTSSSTGRRRSPSSRTARPPGRPAPSAATPAGSPSTS